MDRPTRITTKSATVIDNVFHGSKLIDGVVVDDVNDLLPLFCIATYSKEAICEHVPTKRRITDFAITQLNESLNITDWSDIVNINYTNVAYDKFLDISMKKYSNYCPVIKQAVKKENRQTIDTKNS